MKTPVYSPQSIATERVNINVLAAIRSFLDEDHREWNANLPEIEVAIQNTIHSATKQAPLLAVITCFSTVPATS